jgi:hypothetical protein
MMHGFNSAIVRESNDTDTSFSQLAVAADAVLEDGRHPLSDRRGLTASRASGKMLPFWNYSKSETNNG